MLFWIGLIAILASIIFAANGVEWFKGEDNLIAPLVIVGLALIALYAALTALAVRKFKRTVTKQRQSFGRGGSLFDEF